MLPTHTQLAEKGVQCPTVCAVYGSTNESPLHALFTCPHSRSVWQRAALWSNIEQQLHAFECVRDVFFAMIGPLVSGRRTQLAMLLWSIWLSRNEKEWNNVSNTPMHIEVRAKSTWEDWKLAQKERHPGASAGNTTSRKEWTAPPPGYLKLNVGVAFPPPPTLTHSCNSIWSVP